MVDFVSDWEDCANLARDTSELDFTEPQVNKEQKAAYSKIYGATKHEWSDPTDKRFPAIEKIEQQLTAAYLLQYYGSGTPEEVAVITELRVEAKDSLKDMIAESPDLVASDETLVVLTSLFESYPASLIDDPNSIPYRSTSVSI